MKWTMPEIAGKKRWEVDHCVITLDNREGVGNIAIAIFKAITEARPAMAALKDLEKLEVRIGNQGDIIIDYWEDDQRAILCLGIESSTTMHIGITDWMNRYQNTSKPRETLSEAIANLQNILEVASSKKIIVADKLERLILGLPDSDEVESIIAGAFLMAFDERHNKKLWSEKQNQTNPTQSKTKNFFIEELAKKIVTKYRCDKNHLSITIDAPSWWPENVKLDNEWRGIVSVTLPDGTKLPGFTIDNQFNIIEGKL